MPTVIALDVSLSMTRPVSMPDCNEEYQRRHLAIHGINHLLDHMTTNCKLEFTSLVVFSSLWEQLCPFTRDHDSIKGTLNKVEDYDKTCIEVALSGASSIVVDEWGVAAPCQVVIVTDGNAGVGEGSLKHSLQTLNNRDSDDKFPLPFPFPCKLIFICIAPPNEETLQTAIPMYQKLIDMNGNGGDIFLPDSTLTLKSVQQAFSKLADRYFSPYVGTLKCGHLKCNIFVVPPPDPYESDRDFEHVKKEVSRTLEICGFVDMADIASPPYVSRHLVLPTSTSVEDSNMKEVNEEDDEENGETEDGKTAAFTVLLHGSLKVENMVALTQVGEDWYGMIYSWADNKKKSNLMLSLFEPGSDIIPWLGNLNHLAPASDFAEPPYGEDDNKSPFPVRPLDRRSYAQNCVVWIKPTGVQADIQKILRHARKLPEKQQHFYKELNRLRKAALSFGFMELLDAVSAMLERECTLLPGTAHPDAALQLTHAANALRSEKARDIAQNIAPLRTNFTSDDA